MYSEQSDDDPTRENYFVRAESGKRFLNYIIDLVSFYLLVFLTASVLAIIWPASLAWLTSDSPGFALMDRLVALFCYAMYMSLMETAFKGKSLGKMITRTRAINLDGSLIATSTAFARGLSRAVPFCVFSALGNPCNPWQDRWTNTLVIDEKQSAKKYQ